MKYDLHSHSRHSDGVYSPRELIDLYKGKLDGLALTDHDTIDGLDVFMECAQEQGVDAIPGIELSCRYSGVDVHILGLGIDRFNEDLIMLTKKLKKARLKRAEKIIELFKRDGIFLNETRLLEQNAVGRPHIARELVDKGYVHSVSEAFALYLAEGRRYYVERDDLSIEVAIDVIRRAGGRSILAHPGKTSKLELVLSTSISSGIDGIEVVHHSNSKELTSAMIDFCYKNNLIMTGGSDFHKNIGDIGKYYIECEDNIFVK